MELQISQSLELFVADCIHENQMAWNQKVQYDSVSDYYNINKFKKGGLSLYKPELDLIGNVRDKRLLHLQSYLGLDTLSFGRLGAEATGIDFCENAVAYAQNLSKELNLDTDFIYSDVYELDNLNLGEFDIAFSSYGAICWLPNLHEWAEKIYRKLKPGGNMYLVDFHPLAISLDLFRENYVRYSYFNDMRHPIKIERKGTYADTSAPIETVEYNWNHSIDEIFNAFIQNGFIVDEFKEYPYIPMNGFPNLEQRTDGFYHVKEAEDKYPLMFSLKVTKP